jgi:hypothetical protein
MRLGARVDRFDRFDLVRLGPVLHKMSDVTRPAFRVDRRRRENRILSASAPPGSRDDAPFQLARTLDDILSSSIANDSSASEYRCPHDVRRRAFVPHRLHAATDIVEILSHRCDRLARELIESPLVLFDCARHVQLGLGS